MQTIEKRETGSPVPGGPNAWKWLAAAVMIAVLATAGILFATAEDEPTVATTPQVEEDPVPSTEPEAVDEVDPVPSTEAVDEDEPTPPNTAADAEVVGVTGLPIFDGQQVPGDYEVTAPTRNFIFSSDGNWGICTFRCDGWEDGLGVNSRLVPGGIAAIDPSSQSVDKLHDQLAAVPDLIVGEVRSFNPEDENANWAGSQFSVDVSPDSGFAKLCSQIGSVDPYPCVDGKGFAGIPEFVVHGPITIYVLEHTDGSNLLVVPWWGPQPQPSETEFSAFAEHLEELVQTIRFVD
ncbi:MAG: hypothetical protein WDZ96_08245 [Acidimicrobiia bacterium]